MLTTISEHGEVADPEMVFDENGGTIGRSGRADWVLPDPEKYVSGVHAKIFNENGHFILEDSSTNGVFINGAHKRLGKGNRYVLMDGDSLRFGDYECQVHVIRDFVGSTTSDLASLVGVPKTLDEAPKTLDEADVSAPQRTSHIPSATAGRATTEAPLVLDPPTAPDSRSEPAVAPAEPPAGNAATMRVVDLKPLLHAMGLREEQLADIDRAEFLAQVGHVVRASVEGMMDALDARAEIKNEFQVATTQLRASRNNPLKFVATPQEAINKIFLEQRAGYLPAALAVREGYEDLRRHHLGMLAGMRAALVSVVNRFDPHRIERRTQGKWPRLFGLMRSSAAWRLYKRYYENLNEDGQEGLYRMFGEDFGRAYDHPTDARF